MEQQENEGMAAQVAKNKRATVAKVTGEKVAEPELPVGKDPIEAKEEVAEESSVAEALVGEPTEEVIQPTKEAVAPAEEEPIRIAGKTFKNQAEAIAYAEHLEQERLIAEAHAQGVREALAAQAPAAQPEPEEDFETSFYTNPKEALKKIQDDAIQKAVATIRAETAKEKAWNEFLSEYPDIRRQDAEVILSAHAKTIGALPWEEGRKALANAVYREYDEISNLRRPRTELTQKKPVLSPTGGAARGVTPKTQDEKPLSFADQLRQSSKRR